MDTAKNVCALIPADCTTEATTRMGNWELGDAGVCCKLACHNAKELTGCGVFRICLEVVLCFL